MHWNKTTERLQERANAKAMECGPAILELRAEGLSDALAAIELNRRGYRSVQGRRLTFSIVGAIRRRFEGLNQKRPG